MTFARYLLAVVLTAGALVPVVAAARALRVRLVPGWSGPPGALVDSVIALAIVVGVSELLGAVGLFEVVPIVAGLALTGAATWYFARWRSSASASSTRSTAEEGPDAILAAPARTGRGAQFVAVAATAVVVADWSTQTIAAVHHGMSNTDTIWYHLPVAARFVQAGSVTGLHYVDGDALTAFFPASASMLHGVGILLVGNDFLSPLLNLGFLALALLAAWCIGRPFGVAPATLTGACVVLVTPAIVTTQPGGAYSDTAGAALLLAAVAILLTPGPARRFPRPAVLGIAALAAGLALGIKFQFLVPGAALSVGVVAAAPRGRRVRTGGLWFVVVGLAGGFWYVRNWIAVGNPLPLLDLELGPVTLRGAPLKTPSFTVAQYLFDRTVWDAYFLPGLSRAFGPAWWALLPLVAAGLIFGVVTGRTVMHRVVALVGVVTLAGYVFTPSALGLPGAPIFFVFSLRYAFFGLLLGAVVLPLARVVDGRRMSWVLATFGLVLVATQLDPAIWPTELRTARFDEPIRGIDAIAALVLGAIVLVVGVALLARRDRGRAWRPPVAAAAAIGVAMLAGGFALERLYLTHRYRHTQPLPVVYRWARHVRDERIAIVGNWLQYPLYGNDLSNYVQYVGVRGAHGSFVDIDNCPEWRRALNAGRYTYVLTAPNPAFLDDTSSEERWTRTASAAVFVLRDRGATLWRLDGRLDPTTCPRPS